MPLHPECRQVLDLLQSLGAPDFSEISPAEAREFSLAPPPDVPTPVAEVADCTLSTSDAQVPVRIYRPKEGGGGALVYFHGGGWVIGDLESHDETCRRLCAGAGVTVVAVDYRLAPETRYPGAVTDCYNATQWVSEQAAELGLDATRLAVGGDSAGGNLAAAVAQMARDKGGPHIAFQLLVYPVTDADFDRPSYLDNGDGYLLTRRGMRWFWDHYVPDAAQRKQPYAAPLQGNLVGLPPALVQVAEFDPLRDEGVAYAKALKAAGVKVQFNHYHGMIHGFFSMQDAGRHQRRPTGHAGSLPGPAPPPALAGKLRRGSNGQAWRKLVACAAGNHGCFSLPQFHKAQAFMEQIPVSFAFMGGLQVGGARRVNPLGPAGEKRCILFPRASFSRRRGLPTSVEVLTSLRVSAPDPGVTTPSGVIGAPVCRHHRTDLNKPERRGR